jgi:hypothetical protein
MKKLTQIEAEAMTDDQLLAQDPQVVLNSAKPVLQRFMTLQNKELTEVKSKGKGTPKAPKRETITAARWTPKGKAESLPVLKFEGGPGRPFNLGPAKVSRILRGYLAGQMGPKVLAMLGDDVPKAS